jgi:undecaprenyl-diphosphatase
VSILEAIFLGIVQGATEFLPISSSGHLILIPSLLNLSQPDLNVIAIAHFGTLLAVVVYFRRDLAEIVSAMLRGLRGRQVLDDDQARLGWYLVIGTIPVALVGLLFNGLIDSVLTKPTVGALLLISTGLILIIGELIMKETKTLAKISLRDTIIVALAQVLALLPGISRSGVTISAGLGRGFDRRSAARFGFLLGVPAIAGAAIFALVDLYRSPSKVAQAPELLATFFSAAIVGYICIHFLMEWLRNKSFYPFAAYCLALGGLVLLLTRL